MRKKIYTICTVLIAMFTFSVARAQVIVYFTVDMSSASLGECTVNSTCTCASTPFDPSIDVVEPMGGQYNNWSAPETVNCGAAFTPGPQDMQPVSPGSLIYTITDDTLHPDGLGNIQWKYRIDHSWDNDELRGIGDGNRHAAIPAGATSVLIASVFNDSSNVVTNVSGINNPTLATIQSIYPNPASVSSRIAFNVLDPGNVRVFITDVTGKRMKDVYDGTLPFGTHETSVNVSDLAPGLYLATVQIGSSTITQKLSVVR